MSGRSAYVRVKTGQLADKTAKQQYPDYEQDGSYIYGFSGPPTPQTIMPITYSYTSMPHPTRRRQSISSGSSTYAYPPPPARKPRPIIVASAIEKSDFRTHFDGMSRSVRGKLGRLIKGNDDTNANANARSAPYRPTTASASSESGSRSTGFSAGFAPSLTAVPSLSSNTPPPEGPGSYRTIATPLQYDARAKQQDAMIQSIRRFEGGGKLPQLGWKSLSNNPQLWDENGDTFVFMYMRGSTTKPPPSFRISSSVIYESGSAAFINQLRDSSVPHGWPRFCPSDLPSPVESRSPRDTVASMDFPHHPLSRSVTDSGFEDMEPIRPLESSKRQITKAPNGIQHEIYVAWPGVDCGLHSTIWHITTRNFFAVMYDASALVGTTLYEALSRLFERIDTHPDYLDRGIDKVAWIADYIVRHQFDDVRNNPSYAASLLAFSELPGVQWREGYVEAFVHCVGMLNLGLQSAAEWRYITPHTKMFLNNASLEMENRIHRAQTWLFSFDFAEMWPMTSAPRSSAQGSFERLRKWLCKYYEGVFLHWPPVNNQTWLTHDMIVRLRTDFFGLYEFLVDRDIIFDGSEYRPGQKWAITSKSGQPFRADTSELSFTDILIGFDNRNGFPHIPHPYPITPNSVPVHAKPKASFILKKPATQAELLAQSRAKALSYSEASNVYLLRDQYTHTDLVSNFTKFEQTDMLDTVDPFEARRGRWILIYGILQVLATVSVDSPSLRYSDGVKYHVSPQMKGVVPWAEVGSSPEEEAEHKKSHCWVAPNTWAITAPKARAGAHKPIIWGQYGDGRIRAESVEKISITKIHDISIGRKRAEEWVATTAGETVETGSETGVSGGSIEQPNTSPKGRSNSGVSGADIPSGSSGDHSTDAAAMAARRRRALIHGFTDFQVPADW